MSGYRRGRQAVTNNAAATKDAVLYLRVSSVKQTHTALDIDREGNSIATQREECERKATSLNAPVVAEFVEPGKSAQTIEKRPEFRKLLAYLAEHSNVGYVIVYARSRAFRNVEEAILTRRHLRGLGVRIISTKEDFGESLEADFMEVISDTMNDLQNKRSGEDIKMKMAHKAKNGGTIGRAPIGYLNTGIDVDGRQVNSVTIDQERGPLIRTAFELYATGDYSIEALRDAMTDMGLSARPSGQWKAVRPVSANTWLRILADPYYAGFTYYDGELFPGRHEALVGQSLFDAVQDVLDRRSNRGTRMRTHTHYLRGLLFCERCHKAGRTSRLIYNEAKGNGGVYAYYVCRGRQRKFCDLSFIPTHRIEAAIERHYLETGFPLGFDEAFLATLDEALAAESTSVQNLHDTLGRERAKLDEQENRLLDALMDADLPRERIRERLGAIRQKRSTIDERLALTSRDLASNDQNLWMVLGPVT